MRPLVNSGSASDQRAQNSALRMAAIPEAPARQLENYGPEEDTHR